ncbi:hypothetical protein BJX68DRAFT_243951 [Aspergillus pseudodeflectus]|uniref:Extracellular membrane protein CFEM domain-containing protein n=1 Tax=Aspergillus pseudodeflectus TaxID=176178 RepID=A0ABR4JTQ7_9EURO
MYVPTRLPATDTLSQSVCRCLANALSPDDSRCGSARICMAKCPAEDFQPIIDSCEIGDDGQPDCYVNFYCA